MAFSPLRTGDPTIDRNLDAIKAALDLLNKSSAPTPTFINYKMQVRGTGSNPTKGAIERDYSSYIVVGNLMTIVVSYSQTAAGSAGSGLYTFGLPPGYEFDPAFTFNSSSRGNGVLGACQIDVNGADYMGVVVSYSPNSMNMELQASDAASGIIFDFNATNTAFSNAVLRYSFTATFPVRKL